jgi:hypothetical protein
MPIESWRLSTFQQAAEQMCYQLCEIPHAPVETPNGTVPLWHVYAERMALHMLMVESLRSYGFPA